MKSIAPMKPLKEAKGNLQAESVYAVKSVGACCHQWGMNAQ